MSKCMVCGDEFAPQYKAQRLCQSCLDKFTKKIPGLGRLPKAGLYTPAYLHRMR